MSPIRATTRKVADGGSHAGPYVRPRLGRTVITVHWGAATSAGRVRTVNEDGYVAAPPVFVVADGMGGHAAGEVASGIVVQEFERLRENADVQLADIADVLVRANDRILHRSNENDAIGAMGTTVTGLVAVRTGGADHWAVFNVGDSRVYRFAGGELRQLSVDHSEVEELVNAGSITRDEARTHPRRHVITRSLGSDPAPRTDQWLLPPSIGERFLVCSDGVVGELGDDEIRDHLRGDASLQEIADGMIAAAVAAGGRDNATVVVVEVVGTGDDDVDSDTVPRAMVLA